MPKRNRYVDGEHSQAAVAAGKRVVDPDLIAAALDTGVSPLPPRETGVLRTAGTGASDQAIAATLFLSPAAVRNYLSYALAKVDASNRIHAIRRAQDAGWL